MSRSMNVQMQRKLSELKDHPKQAVMFGNVSDEELEVLAEDMRKNGQKDPVQILPDGTILAGHQRVRAARLLGWTKIDVVVREDLAREGVQAQEAFFVNDNLVRRHLSPLERARCLRRLMEIEAGNRSGTLDRWKQEQLKKLVGERLKLSPRSVNRYLLTLETPAEVQAAFDGGHITLIQAGKVALLGKREQQAIAQRLRDGQSPATVIGQALMQGSDETINTHRSFVRFVSALSREIPLLQGRQDDVHPGRLTNSAPILRSARALLKQLLAQAEQATP